MRFMMASQIAHTVGGGCPQETEYEAVQCGSRRDVRLCSDRECKYPLYGPARGWGEEVDIPALAEEVESGEWRNLAPLEETETRQAALF